MKIIQFIAMLFLLFLQDAVCAQSFVQRKRHQFYVDDKPFYYIGANYWYGGILGINSREQGAESSTERLRKELDFLKSKGINNLRVLAGAEGTGLVHGVERVGPPFQTEKGKFNANVLNGLDILLDEMSKRDMKAVLFLSNNWEWSGGFLQYLRWNDLIDDSVFRRKLLWDEMRDYVSKFYSCSPCKTDYLKQVDLIVNRTNHLTGKKYKDETAIMSWELANEPRPMRPSAINDYKKWVAEVAAFIRSKDKNHLITTGVEGEMGTENISIFEEIHQDKNIDYLTIHIWPKNWSWFQTPTMEKDLPQVISKTVDYINKHVAVAKKLNKPLVIEEFGLPRDHHSIDASSSTTLRNRYYDTIFSIWQQHAKANDIVAGVNFWAYGGKANQIKGQDFWKKGDPYTGDPPMEEQGLNSVFNSDRSTWDLIYNYTSNINHHTSNLNGPSDQLATNQTINLLRNLKRLKEKGIMFGHQDALAYGVNWKYVEGRSDVKDVVGDYPAVYGWELGNLEHKLPYNLDSVPFDKMKSFIQKAYARGGVNTISWHNDNPLNGESAWDTTHGAVASILPGGERHELYKTWLDNLASFLKSLKGQNGEYIPILFRPYHELTGNWFWWCKNTTTPTEYKLLWRFTADYLKNVKGIHHLLYVYNTSGNFKTREAFLEYYPGDDVVDIISFDTYQHGDASRDNSFADQVNKELGIISAIAQEKNKLAAFAETGYETIPYTEWWTNTLWKSIKDHKISYVLVWRNHGRMGNKMHYYAPHKGHPSSNDFINFYKLKETLFEKDIAVEKIYN